jgi:peptide/nickel transport system permease protein
MSASPTSSLGQMARDTGVLIGGGLLAILVIVGVLAPFLGTKNPLFINPIARLQMPSWQYWFGTDMLGRDVFSRAVYGARTSIVVGVTVSTLSVAVGLVIGLVSGYFPWVDAVVARIMDGVMAIPAILLAIAVIALSGASLLTVIVALTIPEVPRVVRLVRSVVLIAREEPYIEAAISLGTSTPLILGRHILPNVVAPLNVQGTYIAASAMLLEAILSFLGIGLPPEIPSWGNIMADGRAVFQIAPWIILFPGILLGIAILAMNILGDGLRDALDPRLARRI